MKNDIDVEAKNFAMIGAAGFVAPRHLQAIHDVGGHLLAAADPHDSVGILDRYFPNARFFTEIERFDRYLEKLRRGRDEAGADYLSICSPNYLHDAHVRLALRVHADAICEKPLVINPWNLDALAELEAEYERRIYAVLQMRLHPGLAQLKQRLSRHDADDPAEVNLTYITPRGRWYGNSWKGDVEKSGGILMNIGIHFFDVLLWIFGDLLECEVHLSQAGRAAGRLHLQRATVRWFLSVQREDLPDSGREGHATAHRSMEVDGTQIDLTTGFEGLHTRVYEGILAGNGFGIEDTRSAIELVHTLRRCPVKSPARSHDAHRLVLC